MNDFVNQAGIASTYQEITLGILLLEADPEWNRRVADRLGEAFPGVELVRAQNHEELKQALRERKLDLVITDDVLGWNDGQAVLETTRVLRPEIPVILFTMNGSIEASVRMIKAGLGDYYHPLY
jgi:two-component system, NtrC family, nitrogen regulation response regulator NtrX